MEHVDSNKPEGIFPQPIEKLLHMGKDIGEFLLRQLLHIQNAPDRHSDHYRGAAAQLDHELYDGESFEIKYDGRIISSSIDE